MLLIPTATADADVTKKYRTAYKTRLSGYVNKMDAEMDFHRTWRISVESHAQQMALILADPDPSAHDLIPQLEAMATLERSLLRDTVTKTRDKLYANIASFKAKAVDWFKTTADKNRFKSRVAKMKSSFVEVFAADAELMAALFDISTAQVGSANENVMKSQASAMAAEDQFNAAMKLLRALQ